VSACTVCKSRLIVDFVYDMLLRHRLEKYNTPLFVIPSFVCKYCNVDCMFIYVHVDFIRLVSCLTLLNDLLMTADLPIMLSQG